MERVASEFGAKHAWLNPLQPWAGTSWHEAGGSGGRWGECQKRENKTCNIRFQSILIIFGYPWAIVSQLPCVHDVWTVAGIRNKHRNPWESRGTLGAQTSSPQAMQQLASVLTYGQIIVGQPGQLPRCPDLLLDSSVYIYIYIYTHIYIYIYIYVYIYIYSLVVSSRAMPKAPTSIPTRAHMRWLLTCSLRPDILPQQLVHPLFHVVSAAPWEHFSRPSPVNSISMNWIVAQLACKQSLLVQSSMTI